MSVEKNVQIMRRWFQEVWNEGRTQTVYELFSPEGIAHGQEGPEAELHGPQEFEGFVRKLRGAFSDMRLTVEDVFAAGDKGVLRWSGVMKHTGDALGMPASGRTVRLRGHNAGPLRRGQGRRELGQLGSARHAAADRSCEPAGSGVNLLRCFVGRRERARYKA